MLTQRGSILRLPVILAVVLYYKTDLYYLGCMHNPSFRPCSILTYYPESALVLIVELEVRR